MMSVFRYWIWAIAAEEQFVNHIHLLYYVVWFQLTVAALQPLAGSSTEGERAASTVRFRYL